MSTLNSKATVDLIINGQQAQQRLQDLRRNAENLETALAKAAAAGDKATLRKLRKELAETRREIKNVESATMQVDEVMRRLDRATPRELQRSLQTLTRQLDSIERGSAAWDEHVAKIKAVKRELADVREEMEPDQGILSKFNSWFDEWQNALMGLAATATGLVMAGKAAVQAYADMEGEMANVRKFTGLGADEVERLNEAFKGMDTRTSREDLNKMAQEAGRLGKQSEEDVLGYVRAADQLNVALDDLGEGATLTLSKLTGIFGDEKRLGTEKSLLAVGSVINELSQNCSASAPYLAEFASRMGGVGAQAGLTVQQIMGYAAVLDSNNQALEASATALSQVITRIYQDPAKYAKVAGLDAKQFAQTVKTDMNGAIIMLMEALGKAGSMDVLSPMFKDMGENGARAIATLSTLAGHITEVKAQQATANQAFAEATSVTREYDVQNNTVQAGLDKARKGFNEMAITLGEKLRPVMAHCISSTSLMMRALSSTIDFVLKYKVQLATLAATIVGYTLVVNAATVAHKAHTAAVALGQAATKAYTAVVHGLRAAQIALSHAIGLVRGNWAKQSAAMADAKLVGTSLAQGYAVVVAAVVLLGTAIYTLIQRQKAHLKALREQREAQRKFAAEARDISQTAADSAAAETAALKQLYAQAVSEAAGKDLRRQAAERLQAMYPKYFGNLSTEDIMLGRARKQYDNLCQSILNVAKARAASEKIKENMKQILELEDQLQQGGVWLGNANRRLSAATTPTGTQYAGGIANFGSGQTEATYDYDKANEARANRDAALRYLSQRRTQLNALSRANEALARKYGQQEGFDLTEPTIPTYGGTPASGTTSTDKEDQKGGGRNTSGTTKHDDPFKAEKDWKATEEANARIAYAKGETDYEAYTNRMNEIAVEFYEKQLAHTELSQKERLAIEADYEEARKKSADEAAKLAAERKEREVKAAIDAEDADYNEKQAQEKQRYIDGTIDLKTYDDATHLLQMEHLRQMVALTKEGTKERAEAEATYRDALFADQKAHQEQTEQAEKEHQQRLADIKKNVFGMSQEEKNAAYRREVADLGVVYDQMLDAARDSVEEQERVHKAYYADLAKLQEEYGQVSTDATRNGMEQGITASAEWLKTDGGQALQQGFEQVVSGMSSIFSGLTSLIQAEVEIQTAAIESRYNREVSLAEGNTYLEKQAEKRKTEEIAKVKNEANKKMFAMQVIQAVAQTATSAINAYSSAAAIPVVGWVMAPIAAATAVAAGMIQVAAIKKQQQASEAQGYAEGGFTPEGRKDETVGVVHAGEWVASQRLVRSPVARPLIEALDYAQRHNAIGTLQAEDVSQTLTAPMRLAQVSSVAPTQPIVVETHDNSSAFADYTDVMRRLQQRLEEPFVTVNTVVGDHGIQQAQDEYERLMRNKTPRSRRA